jgi:hypothetical protein
MISVRFITLGFCLLAFLNLTSSINIGCNFVNEHWQVTEYINTCFVKMDVKTPNQEIESVNGNDTEILGDVKGIWIHYQVCHFIPQGWAKFFTNIIAFGLENAKLQRLSKFDLQPFPNIIRFASYKSELEFLEADVFMYNKKLQSVTLTDNNLMGIGSSVFDILPNLVNAEVEIKCFKKTCKNKDCIANLNKNFDANCQVGQVISNFRADIQKLENDLLTCKKEYETCGLQSCI